jgi:VWFA-related protein
MGAMASGFAARLLFLVALFGFSTATAHQERQAQPVFRSGVELIRVEVTVVDGRGEPVRDLQPEDFLVRIDGKPRDVRFARFYGPVTATATVAPGSGPAVARAGAASPPPPGRVVVIVIDRESLRPGTGAQVLESTAKFIERLSPRDAVGFVPVPGTSISPTREHQRVGDAVRRALGAEPKRNWRFNLSLREARYWEEKNSRQQMFVIERECRVHDDTCPGELRLQAFEMLREARDRARQIVSALASVAESLAPIEHPKQLVFISGGLAFDTETHTWYRDFARKAAAAEMTVYTIEVDQPPADASSGFSVGPMQRDPGLEEGLTTLAGMTGGAFFAAVGTGKGVLDRLHAELENVYQLGVDGASQDVDGKPHEIRVEVKRPGLTLRARREILVHRGTQDRNLLADLLASPVDVMELPVSAVGAVFRGEAADSLKVVLVAEAGGAGADAPWPMEYGVIVYRDDRPTHEVVDRLDSGSRRGVAAVQLAPGKYRLRAAAVDARGRGGVVDQPLEVGLRVAGDLQLSDLLVGTRGDAFEPVISMEAGTRVAAMLEIYTVRDELFADTAIVFELYEGKNPAPLAVVEGLLHATESARRQVAEGELPTETLQPGDYRVSATISVAGAPVGRVTRAFTVSERAFEPV